MKWNDEWNEDIEETFSFKQSCEFQDENIFISVR